MGARNGFIGNLGPGFPDQNPRPGRPMVHMIRPAAFLLFFHLGAAAPAQLAFNELFLDPPGPNAGNQIIELINTSDSPFTPPISWRFCIRPSYIRVPSVQIPAGRDRTVAHRCERREHGYGLVLAYRGPASPER